MKKITIISILVATLTMFIHCTTCFAYTDTSGTWYEEIVDYATKQSMISGYEDNTFRAENTITKAEAIKLVVARYAYGVTPASYPEHWAMNYVRFAEQYYIIPPGWYTEVNLDLPATRKEICYMVIQSCRNLAYKPVLDDTDMVLDFKDLTEENKESINENGIDYAQAIRLCYAMGIIKGYSITEKFPHIDHEGKTNVGINTYFLVKANEYVTRAEATTIVARTYFSRFREYTLVDRNNNKLPIEKQVANIDNYSRTLTYMPSSFYNAGSDTFFKPVEGYTSKKLIDYYAKKSQWGWIGAAGKNRLEDHYDIVFNVSYLMTDEQWKIWKEEMHIDSSWHSQKDNEIDRDAYIQFIKDNKIVIRGGAIFDQYSVNYIENKNGIKRNTVKGIGTLYIENPNNVEDISPNHFSIWGNDRPINKSFKQGYILAECIYALYIDRNNYKGYYTQKYNTLDFIALSTISYECFNFIRED